MTYPPGYVEERTRVLQAIIRAADSYVEVATLIAGAADEDEAIAALREKLDTSESGARAVLEMQFRRLLPDERNRLRAQLEELEHQ